MEIAIREVSELTELEKLALQPSSYSRLSTYDWCPAQYFYNYIVKEPQEYGDKALLGNVIHQALEVSLVDGEEVDLRTLLENYREAREEYDPDETIISDELYDQGVSMLQDFAARHTGAKTEITDAELSFEFVFHGTLLRGFIDSVYVTDTEVIVWDYKSGKWEEANKRVPTNLQLGIYAMYMKYLHPDKTVTAGLYYLQSGKKKKHTFSDEDFTDLQARLRNAIDNIRECTNFLPTQDRYKCKTCSYAKNDVCPTGRWVLKQANKSIKYGNEYYN